MSECLKEAQQRRGRALSDRSRERVEESANKFFSRSHASVEALSMMTDPKNILLAASYIPGVPGAIAGMGEAAYGVHKGTHDMMDATQAVVSGSMGFVQKGYRNLKHGTALVKSFKKTGGTGHKLSTAEAQKLLKGTSKLSSAPTIESLAAKYGGASEQKKSLRFVEMMQGARDVSKKKVTLRDSQPTAQLELTHNVGDRAAFNRKLAALQDLADRGKLFKTSGTMRDAELTKTYRKSLIDRAEQQWGATEPARVRNIKERLLDMDADHLHELQLGGMDQLSALTMLDKAVNRSVGSQLRHQLAQIPEGTKITSIIEKEAAK